MNIYLYLLIIFCITIIFAKWIGPWILNLLAPQLNKIADRLDHSFDAKYNSKFEHNIQHVLDSNPNDLSVIVQKILEEYAHKRSKPVDISAENKYLYNKSIKVFFNNYDFLSFGGSNHTLDASLRRILSKNNREFVLIGESEDSSRFFAVSKVDAPEVYLLDVDGDQIISVEKDAPSFEHFVVLQYELYKATFP
jgi:hypothetical protein